MREFSGISGRWLVTKPVLTKTLEETARTAVRYRIEMPKRVAWLCLSIHRINRMVAWNGGCKDVAFAALRGQRPGYCAGTERAATKHRRKMIGDEKRFHGLA